MFRIVFLIMLAISAARVLSAHQDDVSGREGKGHKVFIGIQDNNYENGTIEVYWNNLIHSMEVKASGDIELNDDETDIKSISKNGFLVIKERNWLTFRELEIYTDANGAVQKKFSLQGRSAEFDAYAQSWLTKTLPDLARRTGVGAAYRIRRIIAQRGMDAAINEMSFAESSAAIQIYFRTILDHPDLNSEVLKKAVTRVSKEISSSSRLHEVLVSAARKFPEDSVLTASLMRAAQNISSSSAHSETLIEIAALRPLDNESAVAMAKSIEAVSSSSAQGNALEVLAERSPNTEEALLAYLDAVETVSSSSEQGHALMALLRKSNMNKNVWIRILKAIEDISSSSIQGETLAAFSRVCPNDDEILRAYLKTAGTVSSSSHQEHAVIVMLNKEDLSTAIMTAAIDFAHNEVSSSSARNTIVERATRLLAEKSGGKKIK